MAVASVPAGWLDRIDALLRGRLPSGATQAGLTVILAAFAPFTAVWYLSSADYSAAVTFNGVMFLAASASAQILLRRFYGPLIRRNSRHGILLMVWLVVYAFVAIQMAW